MSFDIGMWSPINEHIQLESTMHMSTLETSECVVTTSEVSKVHICVVLRSFDVQAGKENYTSEKHSANVVSFARLINVVMTTLIFNYRYH